MSCGRRIRFLYTSIEISELEFRVRKPHHTSRTLLPHHRVQGPPGLEHRFTLNEGRDPRVRLQSNRISTPRPIYLIIPEFPRFQTLSGLSLPLLPGSNQRNPPPLAQSESHLSLSESGRRPRNRFTLNDGSVRYQDGPPPVSCPIAPFTLNWGCPSLPFGDSAGRPVTSKRARFGSDDRHHET